MLQARKGSGFACGCERSEAAAISATETAAAAASATLRDPLESWTGGSSGALEDLVGDASGAAQEVRHVGGVDCERLAAARAQREPGVAGAGRRVGVRLGLE